MNVKLGEYANSARVAQVKLYQQTVQGPKRQSKLMAKENLSSADYSKSLRTPTF